MATLNPPNAVRLLYGNCNHARLAHFQLLATAEELSTQLVAITEPFLTSGTVSAPGWTPFVNGQAALLIRQHLARHTLAITTTPDNTVCVRIGEVYFLSFYTSPNTDINPDLLSLSTFLLTLQGPVYMVGDFNCKTAIIPGQPTNSRGEIFEAFLEHIGLEIANDGTPTWERRGQRHTLDYVCYKRLPPPAFRVLSDQDSCSDHKFIVTDVTTPGTNIPPPPEDSHLDKEMLADKIKNLRFTVPPNFAGATEIDAFVVDLTSQLQEAICAATRHHQPRSLCLPWWSPMLRTLRASLNRVRRKLANTTNSLARTILLLARKELRARYKREIYAAKLEAWRKFVSQRQAWGRPYRVLKNRRERKGVPSLVKPDGTRCSSTAETYNLLLQSKFGPSGTAASPSDQHPIPCGPAPQVTAAQVANIVRTLDNRKAPGPDNIPNCAIKLLHKHHPGVLPAVYTACLTLGHFPVPWKSGRVVFIPKPGKDPSDPEAYRPITLLSGLGKVLEVILNSELSSLLESENLLHPAQYGFRKHRGTEDAVHHALETIADSRANNFWTGAISFDIRGAFDNASWDAILKAPPLANASGHLHRCLASYFEGRIVSCEGQSILLTRGCPQGSVLGPTLWNLIHDAVIRSLEELYEQRVTCYADDTLVVVGGYTKEELQDNIEDCVNILSVIVGRNGLQLNTGKTEVLYFTELRRRPTADAEGPPQVQVNGSDIRITDSIKYLGVHLDNTGRWDVHFKEMLNRCNTALGPLMVLCRRTFGYSNRARRIMVQGAVYSHFLYCSSVWYQRLSVQSYRHAVQMVQRRCDIMCARLYSTTSAAAASVINGSSPLDLRIVSRSILWLLRRELPVPFWDVFTRTTESPPPRSWFQPITLEWQHRWMEGTTGAWTKEMFPSIAARSRTPMPNISFWLGQALTGHGVFAAYLFKYRRRDDPGCPCGAAEETVKHVLRLCPRHAAGRPVDWLNLGPEHWNYMEVVVRTLWKEENPEHDLNSYDRFANPPR